LDPLRRDPSNPKTNTSVMVVSTKRLTRNIRSQHIGAS